MSAYFIALAIAVFFTRAGLLLGGGRSMASLEKSVSAALWMAFGAWGLTILLGWPK